MATYHMQLPWGKKILKLDEGKKLKLDVDFKKEYLKADWPLFYSKPVATLRRLSYKIQDFHVTFEACLY